MTTDHDQHDQPDRPDQPEAHLPDDPRMADLDADPALAAAVLEVEQHAASLGWDQPARLFALVDTAELVAAEPALAAAMGLDDPAEAGGLTPVEQEELDPAQALEDVLEGIVWPAQVAGCAAVVERLVLPPGAEGALPEDAAAALDAARAHPDRQEVRIVAGATRTGSTYCALRLRAHDDPTSVVSSTDLVPGLLALVRGTLVDPETDTPTHTPTDPRTQDGPATAGGPEETP